MKTVAIVGAGPGGLVAAKTLLRLYPNTFQVTVFEKSDGIGGLWNVKNHPRDSFLPPNMPTNLSRFTVGFSDLSWLSMRFNSKAPPIFPKAWQVEEYLQEYARRYLPKDIIKLRSEVTSVEKIEERSKTRWKLQYSNAETSTPSEQIFDYLMLASGFFAKPRPIRSELKAVGIDDPTTQFVHSSKYRSLEDITPKDERHGKKILVIGGANSGGEAATAVAFDISSARHSPNGNESLDYTVVQVTARPSYGLPLLVPGNKPGSFVPLDIKLYDLGKRPEKPEQPISFSFGPQPVKTSHFLHGMLQSLLGTDKFEVGNQLPVTGDGAEYAAPYSAIQEHFAGYVRSGLISVQRGRVDRIEKNENTGSLTAFIKSESGSSTIEDICGVVYATGYTPAPSLEILPDSVKKSLEYENGNYRLPVLLPDDMVASHPSEPQLGFIGFYEGPYWGVMEMQARLLARRWANDSDIIEHRAQSEESKTHEENTRSLREAMRNEKSRVPQFIFSDYLAILEQASRELNLSRNDNGWNQREGSITPARYLDSGSDKTEALRTMHAIHDLLQRAANEGMYAPRATFRALQGNWNMSRSLRSARDDFPSGRFTGRASFHLRRPTDPDFDFEYLYEEQGTLTTDHGAKMDAHRRYVYRYEENADKITVWFVKPDGKAVDYLYHELGFEKPKDNEQQPAWLAKADHLCEADFYYSQYRFEFNGVALKGFTVRHTVTGPKKDYTSETTYER